MTQQSPTQPDSWLDDLLRGFINTWYDQQDKVQEYEDEASAAWVRLKQQIREHEAQAVELARNEVIEWLEADLKRLDGRNWTMDALALDTLWDS